VNDKYLAIIASLSLAAAVGGGAFGAHALRGVVSASDLDIWDKAVLYQLIHSLGVLVILTSNLNLKARLAKYISCILLASIAIFSGSLYLLVLTDTRWLGAITPLGGAGFIISWLLLGVSLAKKS
jgi:uncharacterized membrane protein YgdD (TMEM256/DUF423 family)